MNADKLFDEFMKTVTVYCEYCTKVTNGLAEGVVPLPAELDKMKHLMDQLIYYYDQFYKSASESASKDKMPEYGRPIVDYYGILIEKQRQEKQAVQAVLKQFISVKSKIESYAEALSLYQQIAKKYLEQVSEWETTDECEDLEETVNIMSLFLKAMACKNLDSDEGIKLLMEVSELYTPIIAIGLSRQVFFDGSKEDCGQKERELPAAEYNNVYQIHEGHNAARNSCETSASKRDNNSLSVRNCVHRNRVSSDIMKDSLTIAYFLSRMDMKGIRMLGYYSYRDVFEDMANILGQKPSTIKNMRDEYDPYFDNRRVGWYQREMRPSRKEVFDLYKNVSDEELLKVVLEILEEYRR